jgi:hypothetical protein
MGEAFRPSSLVDAACCHRAPDPRSPARRSVQMRRGGALALSFWMLACATSAFAQGISNARDGNGNLVRNNGIAVQNAPRPITNGAIYLTQPPNYLLRPRRVNRNQVSHPATGSGLRCCQRAARSTIEPCPSALTGTLDRVLTFYFRENRSVSCTRGLPATPITERP